MQTKRHAIATDWVVPEVALNEAAAALPRHVRFYDRTLRGIVQATGRDIPLGAKLELVQLLDQAGVSCIEIGIPAADADSKAAGKAITTLGLRASIAALARAEQKDVELALEYGVDRIYTFAPASAVHIHDIANTTEAQVLETAVRTVQQIKGSGRQCEFTLRDAMRADQAFLHEIVAALVEAGVDILNFPDTTGILAPASSKAFFARMRALTPNATVSAHLHDDFGLAVANALAALEGGAEQIHVSLFGLSERCGMPPLEEVVLCLERLYGRRTGLNLEKIGAAAALVRQTCGLTVFPLKPVFGRNAFTYELGTYMHSTPTVPFQYQPYPPQMFGGAP